MRNNFFLPVAVGLFLLLLLLCDGGGGAVLFFFVADDIFCLFFLFISFFAFLLFWLALPTIANEESLFLWFIFLCLLGAALPSVAAFFSSDDFWLFFPCLRDSMAGLGEGLDVSDEMSESFVVSDCVAAVLTVTCRLLRLILPAVASASFCFEEGVLLVVLLLLDFFSSSEPSELHPSLSPLSSSVTTASRIDRGFARCARFELGLLALLVADLTLADEREAALVDRRLEERVAMAAQRILAKKRPAVPLQKRWAVYACKQAVKLAVKITCSFAPFSCSFHALSPNKMSLEFREYVKLQ